MIEEIVVDQLLARAGCSLESIRRARVAAVCAFVVEAPYQRVLGVAGVSGKVANPYPYMGISIVSTLAFNGDIGDRREINYTP